jgi:O-antigen/teichoic acid export membrane protein
LYKSSLDNQESALKTHFSLSVAFNLVWIISIFVVTMFFVPIEDRWIYWFLAFFIFFARLTRTPRALLAKQVEFQRLVVIDVISDISTSIFAIGLAWYGYGIWSLLAPRIISVIVQLIGIYGYRPVWKPRLGWDRSLVRVFINFGKQSFLSSVLLQALDRVDDIWVGIALGDTALGFYNRAYSFANYPRKVISDPINDVAAGTYAQVKDDPTRFSKAFFRVNAFLVRVNFLFAGILALIAPEFIRIVIGVQWMPMLDAFRLMIVYTLLDPIKLTVANVITAAGDPNKVVRARFVQFVVMIIGLIVFTPWFQISGIALAVDLMLVSGIGILLWEVRAYVKVSLFTLFGVPGAGLIVGIILARLGITLPGVMGSDWRTAGVKIGIFSVIYIGSLIIFERNHLDLLLTIINQALPTKLTSLSAITKKIYISGNKDKDI